jgi:hypothetical protein
MRISFRWYKIKVIRGFTFCVFVVNRRGYLFTFVAALQTACTNTLPSLSMILARKFIFVLLFTVQDSWM